MTFPQDFPSGGLLRSRADRNGAACLPGQQFHVSEDLTHVLFAWNDAGVRLLMQDHRAAGRPLPLTLMRPPRYRRTLWHRALAIFGLRRNSDEADSARSSPSAGRHPEGGYGIG